MSQFIPNSLDTEHGGYSMTTLDDVKLRILDDQGLQPHNAWILETLAPFCNPHDRYDVPAWNLDDQEQRIKRAFRWRKWEGFVGATPQRIAEGLVPVSRALWSAFGEEINDRVPRLIRERLAAYLQELLPPNVPLELRAQIDIAILARMARLPHNLRPLLDLWSDSLNRIPPQGFDDCGKVVILTTVSEVYN